MIYMYYAPIAEFALVKLYTIHYHDLHTCLNIVYVYSKYNIIISIFMKVWVIQMFKVHFQ